MDLILRETAPDDQESLLAVHKLAFGSDEEPQLTGELLADPSAEPHCSLIAVIADQPVGHILFSKAGLEPDLPLQAAILAPLAVLPGYQRQGIGGKLIQRGLQSLREGGFLLVFVLGSPFYYPRHGFLPAIPAGFNPPYPLPPENQNDWMYQSFGPASWGSYQGKIRPAAALDKPVYWWG